MKQILILGASRGLGAALAQGVPQVGDKVWLVSRGRPRYLELADGVERRWLAQDLAATEAATAVAGWLGGVRLDVVIYNAGIWESDAFSAAYDFTAVPPAENSRVIAVNLMAAVHTLQAIVPNVRQADSGKIILIGSTSGMENNGEREVAYNASKFGLRGLAQSLRENLRQDDIGVTCINPGSIATEFPLSAGVETVLAATNGRSLPMQDIVDLVRCIISLSRGSCVKEIDLPAMHDRQA